MATGMGMMGLTFATAGLAPERPDAAEIQLAIKKLRVLASALYVGAHPDDENTDLIAWLVKGRLADAAYLSMTRGDGGQNLIGPEIGEQLGIIRSQELLAARRLDGGSQFFTRAVDFGFSKSPEETLRFWNHDEVLADTVRVFRRFQPDVVITRFPETRRTTHGHHTASALLAREAFAAAADPKRFAEPGSGGGARVKDATGGGDAGPWRVKRLVWNTSRWFYDKDATFDDSAMLKVDVGEYSPLLGESFAELAARSSSQHRSQGFGSSGVRGESLEYLQHVDGERAKADLFEGIDTTWNRIPGGAAVEAILDRAYQSFKPEQPALSVPLLLDARAKILALPAGRWTRVKLADLDRTIGACLGLYLEAAAQSWSAVPGETVKVDIEAANRSGVPVKLTRVALRAPDADVRSAARATLAEAAPGKDLRAREGFKQTIEVAVPANISDSQPYWLREKGSLGMFRVEDPRLIGTPENAPALTAAFDLQVDGTSLSFERAVVFRWTDPARGEQYRPFEVVPAVAVDVPEKVLVFSDTRPRNVPITLRAGRAKVQGTLRLELPQGWRATPASREFRIDEKDATAALTFEVTPPEGASAGALRALAEVGGRTYRQGLVHIEYAHIPTQLYLPPAEARVVRLDLKRKGQAIGYVQGAGDQIPAGLRQIGYTVTELATDELTPERLRTFDAVILGVRAYNTLDRIHFQQPALFDYVKGGGTLIVQYTTSQEMKVEAVAPHPLKLSRERVTQEDAEVRFLIPGHAALTTPNTITQADFDGWVQERGLYFASEWDKAFEAVLSANDDGEPPRNGGLLIAKHGQGYFVYTGYSWFRQIPAGVPGAYRLFVNLISLGK